MYGRAAVPPPKPVPELSEEMALVASKPQAEIPPPKAISWQRAGSASRRSLADGWGFAATGLLIVLCGWGVWAAAGRGTVRFPLLGLALVLAVAAGLFALTRFLGFLVLEQMMGRRRLHARWAHLFAGLFLTFAGVIYFAETTWVIAWPGWVEELWQRI